MTSSTEPERRHAPGVSRVYRNDRIEVTWDPSFCTHVGACVQGAPHVFDPNGRPWVDVDGDAPERIIEVVAQCPTGALHARLLDEQIEVVAAASSEIHVQQDGPLFVRGQIRILNKDGVLIREDTRLALCRCGASQNKPFCDDSHFRIGFKG